MWRVTWKATQLEVTIWMFLAMMHVECVKKFPHRREEEFASMDDDGDGVVSQEELTKYLDPTHKQRSISEANYLITMADRDGDGYMSEKEMLINYKLFTGSSMANYAGYLHDEF